VAYEDLGLEELAAKFGGKVAQPPDYEAMARKFGAVSQDDAAKPDKPVRFMESPTMMDRALAKLPSLPGWLAERGGAVGRAMMGAADPGMGIVQLGANAIGQGDKVNKFVQDAEKQYQEARAGQGSSGFDPARLVGNLAVTAPFAPAAIPESMMGKAALGAATGGAFGAAQPVASGDFWDEKKKQVGISALGGGIASPLAGAAARMIKPQTAPEVTALADAGVTMTPGQILGGAYKRTEDAATSIPVLGDFIRSAKNRSLEDFNRAMYSRALAPIGEDASKIPVGPSGIAAVENKLSSAYDKILPTLTFKPDTQFVQGLNQLRSMAATLPEKEAAQFESILQRNTSQATQNGIMDGITFKRVESNIGKEARKFQGSTDAYQKSLGTALDELQGLFREGLARSNPQSTDLAAANAGWAAFARIRAAGASAGDKSSGFTPAQASAAVRSMDRSAGKGATAKGEAFMQDLTNPARTVLPSSVADSGTPLRHAVQLAMGAAGLHAFAPEAAMVAAPGGIAGMGLLSLPYTKMGQKLMQGLLTKRPESAAEWADIMRRGGGLLGASSFPALAQ
jgi:hypothetical protein